MWATSRPGFKLSVHASMLPFSSGWQEGDGLWATLQVTNDQGPREGSRVYAIPSPCMNVLKRVAPPTSAPAQSIT